MVEQIEKMKNWKGLSLLMPISANSFDYILRRKPIVSLPDFCHPFQSWNLWEICFWAKSWCTTMCDYFHYFFVICAPTPYSPSQHSHANRTTFFFYLIAIEFEVHKQNLHRLRLLRHLASTSPSRMLLKHFPGDWLPPRWRYSMVFLLLSESFQVYI